MDPVRLLRLCRSRVWAMVKNARSHGRYLRAPIVPWGGFE